MRLIALAAGSGAFALAVVDVAHGLVQRRLVVTSADALAKALAPLLAPNLASAAAARAPLAALELVGAIPAALLLTAAAALALRLSRPPAGRAGFDVRG
ncbi:hypothetical protein [Methylocella sp.]|uniref:hypothetical protein n=1 Tax=Methylocella sp. TaxID=1978226 RepID=UPI0035AF316F